MCGGVPARHLWRYPCEAAAELLRSGVRLVTRPRKGRGLDRVGGHGKGDAPEHGGGRRRVDGLDCNCGEAISGESLLLAPLPPSSPSLLTCLSTSIPFTLGSRSGIQ